MIRLGADLIIRSSRDMVRKTGPETAIKGQRSLWAFYLGHNSLWYLNYWVFILEDSCTINQLFFVCEKFSRGLRKPHCHNFFLLQASFLKPVVYYFSNLIILFIIYILIIKISHSKPVSLVPKLWNKVAENKSWFPGNMNKSGMRKGHYQDSSLGTGSQIHPRSPDRDNASHLHCSPRCLKTWPLEKNRSIKVKTKFQWLWVLA